MWLTVLAAAVLTWTPPTLNEDGSSLTDLASYDIWYGCTTPGAYDTVETLLAPASTYTVIGLPDTGTCYFAAKAVNSSGVASIFSNEAAKFFGTLAVPGSVSDTAITWSESLVALPATDSFTDSDDTTLTAHGTSWTANSGAFNIYGNQVHPNTGDQEISVHWNADTFADDQYAQMVVGSVGDGSALLGPAVRVHATAETYYGLYWSNTAVHVHKSVSGTWTQLGTTFGSVSVGDVVKLEVVGTTLEYFKDTGSGFVSQGTRTDSAISSGSAGLTGYSSGEPFGDDWEGGDLGGGASLSIPVAMHQYARLRNN